MAVKASPYHLDVQTCSRGRVFTARLKAQRRERHPCSCLTSGFWMDRAFCAKSGWRCCRSRRGICAYRTASPRPLAAADRSNGRCRRVHTGWWIYFAAADCESVCCCWTAYTPRPPPRILGCTKCACQCQVGFSNLIYKANIFSRNVRNSCERTRSEQS